MLTPHVEEVSVGTCHADREMRCPDCGTRMFTSRAPELVAADVRCPHCRHELELVPQP